MNFDFSDDQKAIQEQARSMLAAQCGTDRVRTVIDGKKSMDRELWQQVAELGWTATAIPESCGGLGLSHLELCVIAQELGRSLAPIPFIASIYLASELIQLAASADQQQSWLPDIASGSDIYTVALDGAKPGSAAPSCNYANGLLNGEKTTVLQGCEADYAIVAALDAQQTLQLLKVELNQAGVERQTQDSLDPTLPRAQIRFTNAQCTPLEGTLPPAEACRTLYDRAAVLLAFEQVGGCEAAIDMAKAYTSDRYAFGRQVASFQAIKHKLADMFVAKELAKSNAYYGAWALASGADALPLAAATARVSATDAYWLCSKENIQAHGGMGFTWEFDCHLYYRRAQALSLMLGGNPYWKNLLVDRLLAA